MGETEHPAFLGIIKIKNKIITIIKQCDCGFQHELFCKENTIVAFKNYSIHTSSVSNYTLIHLETWDSAIENSIHDTVLCAIFLPDTDEETICHKIIN